MWTPLLAVPVDIVLDIKALCCTICFFRHKGAVIEKAYFVLLFMI